MTCPYVTWKEIQLYRYIHPAKNVKQRNLGKLQTPVPKGSPPTKNNFSNHYFLETEHNIHEEDPELVRAFLNVF